MAIVYVTQYLGFHSEDSQPVKGVYSTLEKAVEYSDHFDTITAFEIDGDVVADDATLRRQFAERRAPRTSIKTGLP